MACIAIKDGRRRGRGGNIILRNSVWVWAVKWGRGMVSPNKRGCYLYCEKIKVLIRRLQYKSLAT